MRTAQRDECYALALVPSVSLTLVEHTSDTANAGVVLQPFFLRVVCQALSAKVSTLAHLCSQQLSQQPHYDFGMRAMKSVMIFAGQIRRRASNGKESSEADILIQVEC